MQHEAGEFEGGAAVRRDHALIDDGLRFHEARSAPVVRRALLHELERVARVGAFVQEAVLRQERGGVADAAHERPRRLHAFHQRQHGVVAPVEPRVPSEEQQGAGVGGRFAHRVVGQHVEAAHRALRRAVEGDRLHRVRRRLAVELPVELGADVGALPIGESVEYEREHGFLLLHGTSFP